MSSDRKNLDKICQMIFRREVETLIVENKDGLVRFGVDMVEKFFKYFSCQIIVLNHAIENKTYEQELTNDLISVIHYFTMKSYSHRRKLNKIRKELENERNLVTWKIKYNCEQSLLPLIKQYNSLLRFTYNRLAEQKLTFQELNSLQKSLNNCDQMNSWLRTSAEHEAKAMLKANPDGHAIFGGKKLFIDRCLHKVNKTEFSIARLAPIYSIGEANQRGNRMIRFVANNQILFSINKQAYLLQLIDIGHNRTKYIEKLIELQNSKQVAITYRIDLNYVYLTFNYNLIKQFSYKVKPNRAFAIDLNPNSIG